MEVKKGGALPLVKLELSVFYLLVLFVVFFLFSGRVAKIVRLVEGNTGAIVFNQLQTRQPQVTGLDIFSVQQRLENTFLSNLSAQRWLGFVYLQQGKRALAYEAWAGVPSMGRELVLWGNRWQRYGLVDEARVWYEHATAVSPDVADGWYYLGSIQESRHRPEEAEAAYVRGIQQEHFVAVGVSDLFLRLGALMSQTDWQAADPYFMKAIEADAFRQEETVRAHYLHGQARRRLGDIAGALGVYQQMVQQWPTHYWAWVQLGELTWQVEGDLDQAEVSLKRAIALMPGEKWAYRALGLVYGANGRLSEAETMYHRVLEIDPNDIVAQTELRKQQQP